MQSRTHRIPSSAGYGLVELTNPSGLRLHLLPGGEMFAIRHGTTLINQVIPTPAERSMHRLVLRDRSVDGAYRIVDLSGPGVRFAQTGVRQVAWSGLSAAWEHTVTLSLHPERPLWLWQVAIRNRATQARKFDLLHGQDLGLADEAGVRGNEAFISQYIDHCPVTHPRWGTVLLSRQNLAQSGNAHPWIAQGCLTGAADFATDGFQFFGLSHRLTGEPAAYRQERLASRRLQYEFAYAALQTSVVILPCGASCETTFFAAYTPDHAAASGETDLSSLEESLHLATAVTAVCRSDKDDADGRQHAVPNGTTSVLLSPPVAGDELTEVEGRRWFPGEWRHVERDVHGGLLSFFHGSAWHVVTRRKETLADRPHGHLLRSGQSLWVDENTLGSTVYASGVFNAQVYMGNTNLARGLSVVRNPLDVMSSGGQRVFVRWTQGRAGPPDPPEIASAHACVQPSHGEIFVPCQLGETWRRLGVPSAFEIGLDRVRWMYRLGDICIEAETRMGAEAPAVTLTLRVRTGPPCEFLVTHLLAMGDREMDQAFAMTVDCDKARIECAPDPQTLLGEKWPDLRFAFAAGNPADVAQCGGDELLFADGKSRTAPYAVVQSKAVREFVVAIEGRLTDGAACSRGRWPRNTPTAASGRGRGYSEAHLLFTGLQRLHHPAAAHVAEILPWFAHNACTHFTAPRGLEQYGGAAWGVRDVCQGPVAWLLATRQFAPVRRMLVQVFGQQYEDAGCWPQWFMFEPFRSIQSPHAHGDVPFWPVKALCDYLEATSDFALLDEKVPYTDAQTCAPTTRCETVLQHAMRVLDVLDMRRIPGTALVNYGDGDWDDTLQPSDPSLRANMVSAWTVGLACHAFRLLHQVCRHAGRAEAADRLALLLPAMQADFQRWLLPDGVLAGFLVFGAGEPRPLLHPHDRVTGIRYRLLPMTRAILAELLSPAQAARHLEIIREHLLFPDGVRLMSDPVPYRGGVECRFKRAETAANFGREIGLMYTHAHLRYVEALTKFGRAQEAWEMLGRVTPVQIRARVANAATRQSNAYFSSSDGAFADRYEAAARFEELRLGTVAAKGGWRIYSSGPGLYLDCVIRGMLGIRDFFGDVVFDPVLPRALDGLVTEVVRDKRKIEFHYTVGERGFGPERVCVNGQALLMERRENNPYREGGVCIAAGKFTALLRDGVNVVEIMIR